MSRQSRDGHSLKEMAEFEYRGTVLALFTSMIKYWTHLRWIHLEHRAKMKANKYWKNVFAIYFSFCAVGS